MNKAIIRLCINNRNKMVDVEVPLGITANDLVIALNKAYNLGIDTENIEEVYLKSENPIALLKGTRTLEDFKIINGTIVYVTSKDDKIG